MQVASTLTQADASAIAGAMIWAYQQVTGRSPPSKSSWMMPLAQSAFETANFSSLYDWNVGFISQPSKSQPYFYRGSNPVPFAVYSTLGQGCIAMLRWLQRSGSLAGADNNDLGAYSIGLQKSGYLGNSDASVYAQYASGIAAEMTRYASVVPTAYSEGAGSTTTSPISIMLAAGIGVGIVAVSTLVAHAMSSKRTRSTRRSYA